jgi:YVTN family beta-propeller protein
MIRAGRGSGMISKGLLRARLGLALILGLLAEPAFAQGNYTLFESGPVRPLALSADGTKLFVCNIPDGRLEVFNVTPKGLVNAGSVPVGVDPVAVAVAPSGQVWVVNHLSDSISIVDVPTLRVVRTLLVGDEPRDIVFAGAGNTRAFITTARRGQNRPQVDPNDPNEPTTDLLTPGLGRADVWVFESTALGTSLGGDEVGIVTLFGDTPRALAKSPDGLTVYAAVFQSGNRTTAVPKGTPGIPIPGLLTDATLPVQLPSHPTEATLPAPEVGVMLQQVGSTTWRDVNGGDHDGVVRFSLPDHDVFAIDADASVLDGTAITAQIDHVGTVLFNMVVHPNGTIYVSNTEANNMDRLEGSGATTLRGELHRAQISLISGGVAQQRRLNPQIVYTDLNPPAWVNSLSLAIPTDMAISSNGSTLYVAAFGSQKIGIINTSALALAPGAPGGYDPNDPNTSAQVPLSAGGPGGVVLDETNHRLYVLTRFDNAISIVDTITRSETGHLPVHSPEPLSIVNGRRFFYDASFSSSNGEASCASCHVFGDFDSLAWDLGNGEPNAPAAWNNNPFVRLTTPSTFALAAPALNQLAALLGQPGVVPGNLDFHPLKGPMTTQTLRGMDHGGPMHWRGDRSGGTAQNSPGFDGTPGALDETLAFQAFNPAFVGLLGRQTQISASDMLAFTNFILQVQLPPNPVRAFDRSLPGVLPVAAPGDTVGTGPAAGLDFYNNQISDRAKTCNGCHTLDATQGFFGTGGRSTFEGETQHFKVAHLRNAYQKVGMFGQAGIDGDPNAPQVRGFGYLHDGSIASVMNFLGSGNPMSVFQFPGGDPQRMNVARLMMAFDTDLAPAVGQQLTLTAANSAQTDVTSRLAALITRAGTDYTDPDRPVNKDCDLVVKGRIGGEPHGWWMSSSAPAMFTPDVDGAPTVSDASVRALVNTTEQELTYTCVPPGSGPRLGIDRGGVGEGSQPDTIRDASQCGDVTDDGVVTGLDVAVMRSSMAGESVTMANHKCNVIGANGHAPADCDIADLTVSRRALALLGPALSAGCNL